MLPLILALAAILVLATLRLFSILPNAFRPTGPPPPRPKPTSIQPAHLMILLGSGGHTAEMLLLLKTMKQTDHYRRTYVITSGDSLSAKKAALADTETETETIIRSIPRARRVNQSWVTTPWDCLKCLLGCTRTMLKDGLPDVLVCNGPGSAVFMVGTVLVLKFFRLADTRTVYIESFARVKSLSLSGRILYPLVDRFLVQWPYMKERYPRAEYRGVLV